MLGSSLLDTTGIVSEILQHISLILPASSPYPIASFHHSPLPIRHHILATFHGPSAIPSSLSTTLSHPSLRAPPSLPFALYLSSLLLERMLMFVSIDLRRLCLGDVQHGAGIHDGPRYRAFLQRTSQSGGGVAVDLVEYDGGFDCFGTGMS